MKSSSFKNNAFKNLGTKINIKKIDFLCYGNFKYQTAVCGTPCTKSVLLLAFGSED